MSCRGRSTNEEEEKRENDCGMSEEGREMARGRVEGNMKKSIGMIFGVDDAGRGEG